MKYGTLRDMEKSDSSAKEKTREVSPTLSDPMRASYGKIPGMTFFQKKDALIP